MPEPASDPEHAGTACAVTGTSLPQGLQGAPAASSSPLQRWNPGPWRQRTEGLPHTPTEGGSRAYYQQIPATCRDVMNRGMGPQGGGEGPEEGKGAPG